MPILEFETTVAAPIQAVWEFYEDPAKSLPVLSQPSDDVVVESVDLPVGVGARLVIQSNSPAGRIKWVAKIVEHRPPHAVVFGEEARFVDEQEAGPFKAWRHEHDFEAVGDQSTRIIDRITYRVPYGPVGWIADYVLVRRKLRAMFAYRHAQLHRLFDQ